MRRSIVMTAVTLAIVSTVGIAGATHGGADFVATGTVSAFFGGEDLAVSPCVSEATAGALQGANQYDIALPQDTRGHDFTLTSDTGQDDFDITFWVKNGALCTNVGWVFCSQGCAVNDELGTIPAFATHASVVLFQDVLRDELKELADLPFTFTAKR